MLAEVRAYVQDRLVADLEGFELALHSLSAREIATRSGGHTHVDAPIATQTRDEVLGEEHGDNFRYKMSENIRRQLSGGEVKGMGIGDFSKMKEVFDSAPTGKMPNPLDAGLAMLPSINFLSTFEGVSVDEVSTVDGMGQTLKDAIITMILLDETRAAQESDVAAMKFGWGKTQRDVDDRERLKEMERLLEIPRSKTEQDERQFDEKASVGDKLKEGFSKLKMKASSKS